MKKLLSITLLLFSLSLFVSCSSDDDNDNNGGGTATFDNWNDPKSPNYKPNGYNPILGEWLRENMNGKFKLVFTKEFKFQESWNSKGSWENPETLAYYKVNDKAFKLDRPYGKLSYTEFNYKIVVDTLFMYYGSEGFIKYYRLK